MSMWRDQGPNKKDGVPAAPEVPPADGRLFNAEPTATPPAAAAVTPSPAVAATPAPTRQSEAKESLIAADISIEGKIEGAGHVRLAGRFKGDVNVKGDLTIERGAKLNGGVRANKVIIAGELEGNIESAAQVELQTSGVLVGDVKAGSLTVASGARMRGQADFGWGEDTGSKPAAKPVVAAGDSDAT
ncbi:polymer-forming cytoskeletal protein [Xanthomonas campestris pv. raphani]|uniref:bactofilin family protein n=1 Tax=Xanthomonas campestris TaxID=339 RepID=UPI0023591C64|nr:polymer-forming cytoskeletal protein [Xanthomonas campestris]MDC8746847.1 polymer-forming cytoskeletal protein [Xanthomonas campestris]MEA9653568.1 polymer-forming cytoskeletal protein [Xanthomonas campestris pv. raphani]MEA9657142.1 polymer-forming cytoskeletal protein [Xanthomonas campestris pv. raphani]MEA9755205.1 polymer-forming cytoskeletal protein [Xanthomonas campestris pv. raphani]MEA9762862.1 polymer-forming cytoskeletal protein [Xanthomonas campestris pv. raphani]